MRVFFTRTRSCKISERKEPYKSRIGPGELKNLPRLHRESTAGKHWACICAKPVLFPGKHVALRMSEYKTFHKIQESHVETPFRLHGQYAHIHSSNNTGNWRKWSETSTAGTACCRQHLTQKRPKSVLCVHTGNPTGAVWPYLIISYMLTKNSRARNRKGKKNHTHTYTHTQTLFCMKKHLRSLKIQLVYTFTENLVFCDTIITMWGDGTTK